MTNLYDRTFHLGAERSAEESAPLVIPLIVKYLGYHPKCVVEVGCSTAWWLAKFIEAGSSADPMLSAAIDFGVDRDLLHVPPALYWDADLRDLLPTVQRNTGPTDLYDLAICLEVGEHLPAEYSAPLVTYLCNLSNAVFFGAAHPGQGGVDHVNERPVEFWLDLFAKEGYEPIDFRDELRADPRIAGHYKVNPLLYLRRG
jgi:hypothetical protein